MNLLPSTKIYVAQSKITHAGRGVFAKEHIQKGDVIEVCPVIPLSDYETSAITEGILITYLYYFGEEKQRSVIALGFGEIYNHSAIPNASYKENPTEQTLSFIAQKDIQKDEEITVHYQGEEATTTPLWLEE